MGMMMKNKRPKTEKPTTNIQQCTFTGVKWDGQAVEAVLVTARALENLTNVFRAQNIQIDTLLSISGGGVGVIG
jgi:hypothetical protein